MQGRSMNLSGDLNTIQIPEHLRPRAGARRYSAIEPNRTANELGSPDRA